MNVDDEFSKRVVVHTANMDWEPSPMPGVERRRLDRVNTEVDRVTTVVRYAPESSFSAHVHTYGEEFIVLDGVFEDDYGKWPAGSYIRNPPQSSHTPGSTLALTIFVKLQQFHPDDRTFVHANLHKLGMMPDRDRPSAQVSPLYLDDTESVRFEKWNSNSQFSVDTRYGAEIFVLDGNFTQGADTLVKHSWLRIPVGQSLQIQTVAEGATVWIKSGHRHNLFPVTT